MMKSIHDIQDTLKALLPYLQKIYHIEELSLFGSYVRNEQTDKSDVDILVSFTEAPSLFEFIELQDYIADHLQIKVDLVMKSAVKESMRKTILKETVVL